MVNPVGPDNSHNVHRNNAVNKIQLSPDRNDTVLLALSDAKSWLGDIRNKTTNSGVLDEIDKIIHLLNVAGNKWKESNDKASDARDVINLINETIKRVHNYKRDHQTSIGAHNTILNLEAAIERILKQFPHLKLTPPPSLRSGLRQLRAFEKGNINLF